MGGGWFPREILICCCLPVFLDGTGELLVYTRANSSLNVL